MYSLAKEHCMSFTVGLNPLETSYIVHVLYPEKGAGTAWVGDKALAQ